MKFFEIMNLQLLYPHPRPFSRLDHKTHLAGMVATSGEGSSGF
jgi:hypothetical protein